MKLSDCCVGIFVYELRGIRDGAELFVSSLMRIINVPRPSSLCLWISICTLCHQYAQTHCLERVMKESPKMMTTDINVRTRDIQGGAPGRTSQYLSHRHLFKGPKIQNNLRIFQ